MRVLLVSTYELGHQPLGVATAAAALDAEGHVLRPVDLAVQGADEIDLAWPDAVVISVPMHTALRLALAWVRELRDVRSDVPVAFFGLYARAAGPIPTAAIDAAWTVDVERNLVAWLRERDPHPSVTRDASATRDASGPAARVDRRGLPALDRYAALDIGGHRFVAAAVETTIGCAHRCRHCPVPVVFDGRFRTVPVEEVLRDVEQVVGLGARHVTFADPDFFNGPQHARRVVEAVHSTYPALTFDCTIKVSHLRRHEALLPHLAAHGCVFVVSAFESLDDAVLATLDKGHTAADLSAVVHSLRRCGIEPRPTWLPFSPWTTPASLSALVRFVADHDLVPNVDPVQYTIKLLLPMGSLLVGHPATAPWLGAYDEGSLGWSWAHPDPAIAHLQSDLAVLVEEAVAAESPVEATFIAVAQRIAALPGAESAGDWFSTAGSISRGLDGPRPRLTESWFCCSEPTAVQLRATGAEV